MCKMKNLLIDFREVEIKAKELRNSIDGKTASFIIVLCNFNSTKIFWLYCAALLVLQFIAMNIEILVNGEPAPAIYDPIMIGILVGHYLGTLNKMTRYLLKNSPTLR